jgi:hypothetical protein
MTTIGKMVQENHSALPPPPGHRVAVRQFIRYSGSFVGKDFRFTIERALALLGAIERRFEASTQNLILLPSFWFAWSFFFGGGRAHEWYRSCGNMSNESP